MGKFQVPYTNLGDQAKLLKSELLAATEQVLESGHYILGPNVAAFEKELSAYCQTEFAIGVDNGTSALCLVFRALGIQPGDEIITAPNSFLASASSIALAGGTPVFADVGEDMNLDPEKVEAAITKRTKAILPVHLTGRPARMDALKSIADKHGLFLIEDSAQAVGSKFKDKKVGSFGKAGCFSLHPLKNLHAVGDAGAIVTSDRTLYEKLLLARNHGLRTRSECEFWSFNCRLDEIHAAMLRIQFKHLDAQGEERRRLAFRYNTALKPFVTVPEEGQNEYHTYQTYMIQGDRRDSLQEHLVKNGVEASVHYPIPIYAQKAAQYLGYTDRDFPVTAKLCKRILSLPLYPGMTEAQQNLVIELIAKFYRG